MAGSNARHLPLQRAFSYFVGQRSVCTRSAGARRIHYLSAAALQTGTHSRMHRISRILEMESCHGLTPAIRQLFVFPMRVVEGLHL